MSHGEDWNDCLVMSRGQWQSQSHSPLGHRVMHVVISYLCVYVLHLENLYIVTFQELSPVPCIIVSLIGISAACHVVPFTSQKGSVLVGRVKGWRQVRIFKCSGNIWTFPTHISGKLNICQISKLCLSVRVFFLFSSPLPLCKVFFPK